MSLLTAAKKLRVLDEVSQAPVNLVNIARFDDEHEFFNLVRSLHAASICTVQHGYPLQRPDNNPYRYIYGDPIAWTVNGDSLLILCTLLP